MDAMTETLSVRFVEYEYYDIHRDRETLRLQAITSKGTWYADVDAHNKPGVRRKGFQQYVLGAMSLGQLPDEVNEKEINLG